MTNQAVNTKNLPVYTTSGSFLGRVVGVDVDPTKHLVVNYHVATKWPILKLWNKCLIISSDQVISITSQEMLVDDKEKKTISVGEKSSSLVAELT